MENEMEAKVLLVDDEEEFLETLSSRLEMRGLKVSAVNSGEQAVSEAKEQEYDAIVVDLSMPGIDGLETLRRIKADILIQVEGADTPKVQTLIAMHAHQLGVDFLGRAARSQPQHRMLLPPDNRRHETRGVQTRRRAIPLNNDLHVFPSYPMHLLTTAEMDSVNCRVSSSVGPSTITRHMDCVPE